MTRGQRINCQGTTETQTMYHVFVKNKKTGRKVQMTSSPVTHHEGCVLLSKLTKYPWRQEMLEEVS